jgi:MscS family membrane protein
MLSWLQLPPGLDVPADKPEAEKSAEERAAEPVLVPDAAETLGEMATTLQRSAHASLPAYWTRPLLLDISLFTIASVIGIVFIAAILRLASARLLGRLLPALTRRMDGADSARTTQSAQHTAGQLIGLGALFFILALVPLPQTPLDVQGAAWRTFMTIAIVFAGVTAYRVLEVLIFIFSHRGRSDYSKLDQSFAPLLRNIVKAVVIVLVIVAVVQAWGYSAGGLLAGVGIGGLALAFAAQDMIGNIFGSFVIYSDRPYKIGDWVRIDTNEGVVEEIGFRSTRIRTWEDSLLTVPNKDVTSHTVENFTTRTARRICFTLGVTYSTPPEAIEALRSALYDMLLAHPEITSRRMAVRFSDFGESSLNILVDCHVLATRFEDYYRLREEVLLWILRYCNANDIGLAFPTRTLEVNGEVPVRLTALEQPVQSASETDPPPV